MGFYSTPAAPPPPDPRATAQAQTAGNVATATANTRLTNADESGPLGSVKYTVVGNQNMPDGFGGTISVPKYKRTETLDPQSMTNLRQEQLLDNKLNGLAMGQTDRLNNVLSQPINMDGLPEAPGDQEQYRQKVEQAMHSRLDPQMQRSRAALETQLVNQGLTRGSAAFNEALDQAGRQENDANIQTYLASGQEARTEGEFQATNRERALQERLLGRNQPINEITALMGAGQVAMPQFTPYRPNPMSETPYGQYVYQGYQGQLDAWKQKVASQSATTKGLFDLGSTAVKGMFAISDMRLKRDIERIGTLPSGLGVYSYRYLWSDEPQVGVMAQEVAEIIPEAVVSFGPWLAVDYAKVR